MLTIATLALLAFLFWRLFLGYNVPEHNYRYLSRAEVAALESVSAAMFPPGGAISVSYKEANVVAYVDEYFSWHAPANRFMMHLLMYLMEHATLLFVPSYKRLSQLDPETRERYLASWESSNLYPRRLVFSSLRAILCMAYLANPQVDKELGVLRPAECQKNAVHI